jgi:diguanylate cyclase (GGDEF)-like protein
MSTAKSTTHDRDRQALRLRRYLAAAGTSALVIVLFFLLEEIGMLPLEAAVRASIAIVVLSGFFYMLLITGINLRLKDPSLTTEQIGSAILVLAYVMYHAPDSRGTLMIVYLMALMFGVLKLGTPRMLALAALTFCAHSFIVWLSFRQSPSFDLRSGFVQLAVLAVVLPWFAVMGGYVNRLRRRLSDTNRTLVEAVGRIEQLAIRDPLTEVFNRRYLMEALARERSRATRLGSPLSLCLLDVDHFKSVNDAYGHPAGDAVLVHFAATASIGLRANDVFGRYGGEEFMLIVPDTDATGAAAIAERIRERIAGASFPGVPSDRQITVTIGLATVSHDETVPALIARTDAALYAGKQAGRNRLTMA